MLLRHSMYVLALHLHLRLPLGPEVVELRFEVSDPLGLRKLRVLSCIVRMCLHVSVDFGRFINN